MKIYKKQKVIVSVLLSLFLTVQLFAPYALFFTPIAHAQEQQNQEEHNEEVQPQPDQEQNETGEEQQTQEESPSPENESSKPQDEQEISENETEASPEEENVENVDSEETSTPTSEVSPSQDQEPTPEEENEENQNQDNDTQEPEEKGNSEIDKEEATVTPTLSVTPQEKPDDDENNQEDTENEDKQEKEKDALSEKYDEIEKDGIIWLVEKNGKKAAIKDTIELNKTYTAPFNDKLEITFTKMPKQKLQFLGFKVDLPFSVEEPNTLVVSEIVLTEEEKEKTGSLLDTAYEVTSSLDENDQFEYTLTLPAPEGEEKAEVKYSKEREGLVQDGQLKDVEVEESLNKEEGTIEIKRMNHMTVFVVTIPNPVNSDCFNAGFSVSIGDECYNTIQEAVDAAADGDTIQVAAGTYNEQVLIDKNNITLVSLDGAENTTIDGTSSGVSVIQVSADGVEISGFTITGSGSSSSSNISGIQLGISSDSNDAANNATVSDNIITGNDHGVLIAWHSGNNLIQNNRIINNTIHGVFSGGYSGNQNNKVNNNVIQDNGGYGIFSKGSPAGLLDGTENYWGDASDPSEEGPGTGDGVSENISYCPWLDAESGNLAGDCLGNLYVDSYQCPADVASLLSNGATKNDFKPDDSGDVTADLDALGCFKAGNYNIGHIDGATSAPNGGDSAEFIGETELNISLPEGDYMLGEIDDNYRWVADADVYGFACNGSNPSGYRDNNAELVSLSNSQDIYCNLYKEITPTTPEVLGSNAQSMSATYDEGNPDDLDFDCHPEDNPLYDNGSEKYASNWTAITGTNIKYIRHNTRPDGSHLLLGQTYHVPVKDPYDLNNLSQLTDVYEYNHSNGWGSFGGTEGLYSTQVLAFADVDTTGNDGRYDVGEPISEWSNMCYSVYDKTAPDRPVNIHFENSSGILSCGETTDERNITVLWNTSDDNIDLDSNTITYEYEVTYVDPLTGDESVWTTTTTNTSYSGSFAPNGEGLRKVRVRAGDKAGNWSDWSDECAITYDVNPPAPEMVKIMNESGTVDIDCGQGNGGYTEGREAVDRNLTITWNPSTAKDISHYKYGVKDNSSFQIIEHRVDAGGNLEVYEEVSGGLTYGFDGTYFYAKGAMSNNLDRNPFWYTVIAVDQNGNESEFDGSIDGDTNKADLSYACGNVMLGEEPADDETAPTADACVNFTAQTPGSNINEILDDYGITLVLEDKNAYAGVAAESSQPRAYSGETSDPSPAYLNACLNKNNGGGGFGIFKTGQSGENAGRDVTSRNMTFTFEDDKTVDRFVFGMKDYGDYQQTDMHNAVLIGYDDQGTEIVRDTVDASVGKATGDACSASIGDPGNYYFELEKEGIAQVKLQIVSDTSTDWGVAFTNLCMTESESVTPTPSPTPTSTPVADIKVCKENESGEVLNGWAMTLGQNSKIYEQEFQDNHVNNSNGFMSDDIDSGEYIIRVSGTYQYGNHNNPSDMIADAKSSQRHSGIPCGTNPMSWVDGESDCMQNTYGEPFLQVQVGGEYVNWVGDVDTHVYEIVYDHEGGPIQFNITDSGYGDNKTSTQDNPLTVEVFTREATQTTGDGLGDDYEEGCTTFTDVPYGEHILSEDTRSGEGWTVVSEPDNSNKGDEKEDGEVTIEVTGDETFTFVNNSPVNYSNETTADIKVCKENESGEALDRWEMSINNMLVEEIEVDSKDILDNDYISSTLIDGEEYLIEVSGTIDANDKIISDARYSSRDGGAWQDWVQNYETETDQWELLELQMSEDAGTTFFTPEWGDYNEKHVYTISYTGKGDFLYFRINDILKNGQDASSNNDGSLMVKIYKVGTSQETDTDGCTTFTDVPYGEHTLSEDTREDEDWTVVSEPVDDSKLDGSVTITVDENTSDQTFTFVNKEPESTTSSTPTPTPTSTSTPTPTPTLNRTTSLELSSYIEQQSSIETVDKGTRYTSASTITNTGDTVFYNVSAITAPIQGATYVSGSWTGTETEPEFHSPGKWTIGTLQPGESVTFSYAAQIDGSQEQGTYKDLVWAQGETEDGEKVQATGVDSRYISSNQEFVGDEIKVESDYSDVAGTDINIVEERTEEGEVLGASTGLPATGAKTLWLIIASILTFIGSGLVFMGIMMKRTEKKTPRLHPIKNYTQRSSILKTLASFLVLGFITGFLIVGNVLAASGLDIRLEEQKSPTGLNNFKLSFATLDIQGRDITVKCYKKGPSDSVFTQFASVNVRSGGDSQYCQVDSSVMNQSGTYQFYAIAQAGSDESTSSTIAVDYDITSTPGTPASYSKSKSGCTYTIKFKTANDDGKTKRVELYRSQDKEFTANSGSRVASKEIGSNQDGEFQDTPSECSEEYYYAIRSFDSIGNASGLTGDKIVNVTVIENTSTTTTSQTTTDTGTGAIAVNNANIAAPGNETVATEGETTEGETAEEETGEGEEGEEGETTEEGDVQGVEDENNENKTEEGSALGDTDTQEENNNSTIFVYLGIFAAAAIFGVLAYFFIMKNKQRF